PEHVPEATPMRPPSPHIPPCAAHQCENHTRDGETAVQVGQQFGDAAPVSTKRRAEPRDETIPDARREHDGHERADGAEVNEPRERRNDRADAGEEATDEDAGEPEAEILALDEGNGL